MKKLYLVRHGETNWNLQGKTQGIRDSKLTYRGIKQAELLGDRLQKENIEVIYSSNLSRAKSTADIIKSKLDLNCYYHESLIEMNFGIWEGLTIHEIREKYPIELKIWHDSPHELIIPQGDKLSDVQNRILNFVNEIILPAEEKKILIISHNVTIKLFILFFLNMNLSEYYRLKQDNCGLNIIELQSYGPILLKYNDTCHLDSLTEGDLNK